MSDDLPRLRADTLGDVTGAALPGYDRSTSTVGIVHLGMGAFARAHVATYCDDLLAAGHTAAGICGVSLHSRAVVDALRAQDGLFTVVEREDGQADLRVVGSVLETAHGPQHAIAALRRPDVHTVTLTVTEKGYCRLPASGLLDEANPDVAHDLAHPDDPRTAPGVLVAALRRRRDDGTPAPIVLSCDNLPDNGAAIERVTLALAERIDPAAAAWIADEVRFPSTMVDRIVPATTADDLALVEARTGHRDLAAVACEPFRQWVIEQVPGLAPFDRSGATLVDAIEPWETLKLRLLNGPHSALAYLGLAAGHDTIAEAVGDAALHGFVAAMAEQEVVPTLPPVAIDPTEYAASCRHRFANPALGHRTAQVAMDGSQKLPQRVIAPMLEGTVRGISVDRLALVVAAWMTHVERAARAGTALDDPLADELVARVRSGPPTPAGLAGSLLRASEVFGPGRADDPAFREPVVRALGLLADGGATGAATALS